MESYFGFALKDTETQPASWNTQELEWWLWQSLSLSLPPSVFYIPSLTASARVCLFSPIQLLHGVNPEPSSLLLSIHSCSYTAESLPGVALLRGRGGWREHVERKNKKHKETGRKKTERQGKRGDVGRAGRLETDWGKRVQITAEVLNCSRKIGSLVELKTFRYGYRLLKPFTSF